MKILIIGAGIVGSTYAWQLSESGCDITVFVKPEKRESIEKNGISIYCTDFRNKSKDDKRIIFRLKVIDKLLANNDFDYLIVTTSNIHLKDILPMLKESAGKAHIIFFQNVWIDDFREIEKYLSPSQYFFGFPFMVGGGREKDTIRCAISGLKYSHTPLGELDGTISDRVRKIANALEKANLKPMLYKNIKLWLITHYAVAAGLSAGIMKAKSARLFANDKSLLKHTFKAIREGFSVCDKMGFNPKIEKANRLYYLPLCVSTTIAKKVYSNEALCLMFDGHTQHAPLEMQKMLSDIINCGNVLDVKMPFLTDLSKDLI